VSRAALLLWIDELDEIAADCAEPDHVSLRFGPWGNDTTRLSARVKRPAKSEVGVWKVNLEGVVVGDAGLEPSIGGKACDLLDVKHLSLSAVHQIQYSPAKTRKLSSGRFGYQSRLRLVPRLRIVPAAVRPDGRELSYRSSAEVDRNSPAVKMSSSKSIVFVLRKAGK
jgi:hypothetical protein